eukprot:jgi/Bigna1/83216/fgenesh1_pg.104_\
MAETCAEEVAEDKKGQLVSEKLARSFLRRKYGIEVSSAKPLPSYDDQNLLITGTSADGSRKGPEKWVMKISCRGDSASDLRLENTVMRFLADFKGLKISTPDVIESKEGHYLEEITAKELGYLSNEVAEEMVGYSKLHVRLVTYIEGEVMAKTAPADPDLLRDLGNVLGGVDVALRKFKAKSKTNPAKRDIKWDLMKAEDFITAKISYVKTLKGAPFSGERRLLLVSTFLEIYQRRAKSIHLGLRESIVHNDANDYNVLVEKGKVSGIIDFGDLLETKLINNLAIACAYAMLGNQVVASAYESTLHPDNPYILISAKPGWECLQTLATRVTVNGPANRLHEVLTGESKDKFQCKGCSVM